jgi:hypothetical protein
VKSSWWFVNAAIVFFRIVVKSHHPVPILIQQIGRLSDLSLSTPVLKDLLEPLGLLTGFRIRNLTQHQQGRLVQPLGNLGQ